MKTVPLLLGHNLSDIIGKVIFDDTCLPSNFLDYSIQPAGRISRNPETGEVDAFELLEFSVVLDPYQRKL